MEEGVEPIVVFDGIDDGDRTNVCFHLFSVGTITVFSQIEY